MIHGRISGKVEVLGINMYSSFMRKVEDTDVGPDQSESLNEI